MGRSAMRAVLSIVALVAACLALTACEFEIGSTDDETTAPATPATPATTTGGGSGDFAMGDSIAAMWTDGNLWLANVSGIEGDQLKVTYADDGSSGTVPAAECRPIPDVTFAVGDRVLAIWQNGRFYPGEVTEWDGVAYTVKWDDGSVPSQVPPGRIIAE